MDDADIACLTPTDPTELSESVADGALPLVKDISSLEQQRAEFDPPGGGSAVAPVVSGDWSMNARAIRMLAEFLEPRMSDEPVHRFRELDLFWMPDYPTEMQGKCESPAFIRLRGEQPIRTRKA